VIQKFSLEQLRRYARNQAPPLGEGWINVALAEQRRTGEGSEQVRDWLARRHPPATAVAPTESAKPDASGCPDCHGSGWYYPGGFANGTARCPHARLGEAPAASSDVVRLAARSRGSPAAVG